MTLTFYKYNSYYLRVPENVAEKPMAYSVELLRRLVPTAKQFFGSILAQQQLGISCPATEEFVALIVKVDDAELLIIGSASEYSSHTLLTGLRINEEKLKYTALTYFHNWRKHLDQQMIEILLEQPQSLRDPLIVCAQYAHSDAHSLWIYNPYTEVFTCVATSHEYEKTFLTKDDKGTLFDFLKSKNTYESRQPTHLLCPNTELAKCKTLNRISIPLDGTGTVAILNLYSLHTEYKIPDQVVERVKQLVQSKYTESRIELHKNYEEIEQFFTSDYKLGELDSFLRRLTQQITKYLYFECCSIFLRDVNPLRVKLVATTDAKLSCASVDNVFYKVDSTSLTGLVAFTKKLQVSYDLKTDTRNSQNYSESTLMPGKNWIGVPIKIDSTVLGVIRVKNKYSANSDPRQIRNIRPADIEYMESIATMLASLMQIEELYVKSLKELTEAQKKIIAQNDFNTVFLHEIKTPISTFSLAPYAIKKRADAIKSLIAAKERIAAPVFDNMIYADLDRIEKRLSDISVMADRLKFIADTYFFDLIVAKNKPTHLGVLADIVYPVVNITREYFRRNYGLDLRVDTFSLQKLRVYADQTMVTLVLNALVDNAGKYTMETQRPVTISGHVASDGRISIIVSNYGLAIDQEEEEKIFEKGERGRIPKALNISGTGVGLHLGRKIMREQKGDLRLLQRVEPVKFAMILPTDL